MKTKIKTEWDFTLLYKNDKDPQIEKDVVAYEKACVAFEKKYKGKNFEDKKILLAALSDWEKIAGMPVSKPLLYFSYQKDTDSSNQLAEAMINKLDERLTKAGNKLLFFDIAIGKISIQKQKEFLRDRSFNKFHYYLSLIFKHAKYYLSEAEEKILSLKSLTSYSMWVDGQQKVLSRQTVKWKGQDLPLPKASGMISNLPTKDRRKLYDAMMQVLKDNSSFAESEINAVITDKKISDELRRYPKPYSSTILGYQNEEKSVETLVATVTKNFSISHSFYDLKARLLKEKVLEYADKTASIGTSNKKYTLDESLTIARQAFSIAGKKYMDTFDSFLKKGQIDIFPKKGKKGGAYCSYATGAPTFVMLNTTESENSIMTIGHEMGHAFHGELSKAAQGPLYDSPVISVAEVASTFFENFVFEELIKTMTEKEKVVALHNRINDDMSTIFRQIAFFNFETELHTQVRSKGAVSKEEMAALLNTHMKSYLGPKFKMKETDGYNFVNWPHLRYFFYVYSYSYGQIISKALYAKYKENPAFMQEIEKFLSAGRSKSPEDIFMDIGIDASKPEFFEQGLKEVAADIKRLEKLAKEVKMI